MASEFPKGGNTSLTSKVRCTSTATDTEQTQKSSCKKMSASSSFTADTKPVKRKRRKICYKDKHKIGRRKATEKVITYNETFRLYDSVLKELCKEYQGIKKSSALQARKRKAESLKNTVITKKTKQDEEVAENSGDEKKSKRKNSVQNKKEKETKSLKDTIERKRISKKNGKNKFIRTKREASLNAAAKVNLMLMEKNGTDTDSIPSECGVEACSDKIPDICELSVVNDNDEDKPSTSEDCDTQKSSSPGEKAKLTSGECSSPKKTGKEKTDVIKKKDSDVKKPLKRDRKKNEKTGEKNEKEQKKPKSISEKNEKTKKTGDKCKKNDQSNNKSKKKDNSDDKNKSSDKCVLKKKSEKDSVKKELSNSQSSDVKKKQLNKKSSKLEVSEKRVASLNSDAIREAVKERKKRINRRVAARTHYTHIKKVVPAKSPDVEIILPKKPESQESTDVEIVSSPEKTISQNSHWVDGFGPAYCSAKKSYGCSSDKDSTDSFDLKAANTQDSDVVGDETRPNSAIDVMAPFMPPKSNSPCCMGNVMAQSQTHCFSPCCAHSMGMISSSQYQSFSLGTYSNLNNVQMIPYQQSGPYTSAFNVPFQSPVPHYGYYPSGYYQSSGPTGPSVLHQSNSESCLVSHTVPLQVGPHAEVKVLINNPHSAHPLIQPSNLTVPSPDLKKELNHCCAKTVPIIKTKIKVETKGDGGSPKLKRKQEKRKNQKEKTPEKSSETIKSPPPVIKPNNHQWTWYGEPFKKLVPMVDGSSPVERKCYPSIQHEDGDLIQERDCVLLMSGPRKRDIPFVAKVSALWENDADGEIMFSLLWYYRPEHTEGDRKPQHIDCELFASKHRDENSVACIEDKCFVLTYNEYCRYSAEVQGMKEQTYYSNRIVPEPEAGYNRLNRLPPLDCDPGVVFMCRGVYDIDKKRILKNPS